MEIFRLDICGDYLTLEARDILPFGGEVLILWPKLSILRLNICGGSLTLEARNILVFGGELLILWSKSSILFVRALRVRRRSRA